MKWNPMKDKPGKGKRNNVQLEKDSKLQQPESEQAEDPNVPEVHTKQSNNLENMKNKAVSLVKYIKLNRMDPTKSVGVRLFLIFFVATMIFVLSLGILSYQMAKKTIQDNALIANQQTINQTTEKLDIILKRYEEGLQQAYFDKDVQGWLTDLAAASADDYEKFTVSTKISTKLNNWAFSSEGVQAVYIIPQNDTFAPVTTGIQDKTLLNDYSKMYTKDALKASNNKMWVQVVKPANAMSTIEPVFRLVKSMSNVNGNHSYYVIADIKVQMIADQLKKINLGEGSQIQLVDSKGIIVSATKEEDNGKPTPYTYANGNKSLSNSAYTKDANKKSILGIYSTLSTSGWRLLGVVPVDILVKDAKGILMTTYISAAVVALIAVLIGLWMVRMISLPLRKLMNLMQEGAKGNLNVRIDHHSKDEIGQLSGSFNLMMEQITELVKKTNTSAQEVLDTASELEDASHKTALSAREIAVATEEIANGAGSLAGEAERGNALTEAIGSQMELVIEANGEMQTSAKEVERVSQLGTEYLHALLQKTHMTVEITHSLSDKVESLRASTTSVRKVLEVMQNITKQTNILSLNATIEAARAGAAGRGFMVVADEIRQLAEQSRQSITMVGQITDQIQTEMNETVKAIAAANPLFEEQISSVQETSQIFVSVQDQMGTFINHLDSVTASIDNLNQSQSVLSDAMSNVSAVAEESSATSEEVASLSNEQQNIGQQLVVLSNKLSSVSNELKSALSEFTV
ncbi:methyl-accepting chemotaxis protein [Paenibacillus shirakamiensis]|uniref:Methyl-accepting chemotaxis protein n=1 Tax=Paenibacillus shirakamiensis TaxID=1265935 RepID=A0ABS4JBE6_9BACL|nr:methyl-accepting chemotaxis protein [Paenibacillus shirakamiensis]MBP1999037.1 methyl-accepting chemotaxis protein [Paenibacillus shirakamiensis]